MISESEFIIDGHLFYNNETPTITHYILYNNREEEAAAEFTSPFSLFRFCFFNKKLRPTKEVRKKEFECVVYTCTCTIMYMYVQCTMYIVWFADIHVRYIYNVIYIVCTLYM